MSAGLLYELLIDLFLRQWKQNNLSLGSTWFRWEALPTDRGAEA
jgi:hypothetical protein